MKNEIKDRHGVMSLYTGGSIVLEKSLSSEQGVLFVVENEVYVTKDELEELVDATIISNAELPEVTVVTSDRFNVGGYAFHHTHDSADRLREVALKYLAAAKEVERNRAEEKAKEKAEKEAKDAEARNEAYRIQHERLNGIDALAQVLRNEGDYSGWLAKITAGKLYDHGVRATGVE